MKELCIHLCYGDLLFLLLFYLEYSLSPEDYEINFKLKGIFNSCRNSNIIYTNSN